MNLVYEEQAQEIDEEVQEEDQLNVSKKILEDSSDKEKVVTDKVCIISLVQIFTVWKDKCGMYKFLQTQIIRSMHDKSYYLAPYNTNIFMMALNSSFNSPLFQYYFNFFGGEVWNIYRMIINSLKIQIFFVHCFAEHFKHVAAEYKWNFCFETSYDCSLQTVYSTVPYKMIFS